MMPSCSRNGAPVSAVHISPPYRPSFPSINFFPNGNVLYLSFIKNSMFFLSRSSFCNAPLYSYLMCTLKRLFEVPSRTEKVCGVLVRFTTIDQVVAT